MAERKDTLNAERVAFAWKPKSETQQRFDDVEFRLRAWGVIPAGSLVFRSTTT
jgi:hypothetical protein